MGPCGAVEWTRDDVAEGLDASDLWDSQEASHLSGAREMTPEGSYASTKPC